MQLEFLAMTLLNRLKKTLFTLSPSSLLPLPTKIFFITYHNISSPPPRPDTTTDTDVHKIDTNPVALIERKYFQKEPDFLPINWWPDGCYNRESLRKA